MTNKEFIQKWTDALRENDMSKGPLVPLTGEPTVSQSWLEAALRENDMTTTSYKPDNQSYCALGAFYEITQNRPTVDSRSRLRKFLDFCRQKYRNLIYRLTVDLDEIDVYHEER